MKYLPLLLTAFTVALMSFTQNLDPTPKSTASATMDVNKNKVMEAVENWASSTFYKNDGKKFERFMADYSDEYYIYQLKIEMYEKKLRTIESQKAKGSYPKSDIDFDNAKQELTKKINTFKEMANTCSPKVSQYSIKYWTNVQMSNGILMYYSFNVTLDDNYKVVSHKIVDKIGDKGDDATIVYKK